MERYRSGHNEAVLKTVCPQGHVGSNPTLSGEKSFAKARLFLNLRGDFKSILTRRGKSPPVYNKEAAAGYGRKDMKKDHKLKKFIYEQPGIIKKKIRIMIFMFVLLILLAGTLFLYYHNPKDGLLFGCPVKVFTGFNCPGCGAGRACYALLHGRWYEAFRYNALLVILLPWIVLYYAVCSVQWLIYGKERLSIHIPEWFPQGVFVVMCIYGIVRNIKVYPFVLLAPTAV